jgi:hypothetical protein
LGSGLSAISMPIVHQAPCNDYDKALYLSYLSKWGFNAGENDIYYVDKKHVNIIHWFGNITVLRYLTEAPWFVHWWAEHVRRDASLDPWMVFMVGHYCGVREMPSVEGVRYNWIQHPLLQSVGGVFDPQAINLTLSDVTGFAWSTLNLNSRLLADLWWKNTQKSLRFKYSLADEHFMDNYNVLRSTVEQTQNTNP